MLIEFAMYIQNVCLKCKNVLNLGTFIVLIDQANYLSRLVSRKAYEYMYILYCNTVCGYLEVLHSDAFIYQ